MHFVINHLGFGVFLSLFIFAALANPSSIKMVISMNLPYHFFNGDVNDPNVVDAIKNKFISLLNTPYVLPIFCQTDPVRCNKDNVDVKV